MFQRVQSPFAWGLQDEPHSSGFEHFKKYNCSNKVLAIKLLDSSSVKIHAIHYHRKGKPVNCCVAYLFYSAKQTLVL